MYYSQQPTYSGNNPQASDHVPGQPKHHPSLNSMSVPALLREQSVRHGPAIAPPYSSSSHSHLLYQSSHNDHHHLSQDLEPHSNWSRLPYALEQTVNPAPERDHIHRFAPSHQHPHDTYHRTDETRASMSSFIQVDNPFSAGAQLEHNLVIPPNVNYISRQRLTVEPPSPSPYPSHTPQSPTHSLSEHTQTQTLRQTPAEDEPSATSQPKKSRRAKPHIDLAPDQPLTTQGKPRARVYVACIQCRTRKIRCDGAKPACHNCVRRAKADDACSYDVAPKRRGPDKVPGARQRITREARMGSTDSAMSTHRRRRRRDEGDANENSTTISEDTSGRDEGTGGVTHSTSPMLTLPPLRPPSLALDPQLPHITPFPGSSIDLSTSPRTQIHHEASSSTSAAVLDPGFESVIPSSVQDFAEDILYTTNTQGLYDVQALGGIDVAVDPPPFLVPFLALQAPPPDSAGSHGYLVPTFVTPPQQMEGEDGSDNPDIITFASEPSVEFTRKTWWDSLLAVYTTDLSGHPISISLAHTFTSTERHRATVHIMNDLRFFFRTTSHWFSFINVPSFLSAFIDPRKRGQMQPSLVYAVLAISTNMQSSDVGLGKEGREMALRLRDAAQGALDASLYARWVDEELAQAAWLLSFFEIFPHPLHSSTRAVSSMFMLDTIIRTLSLTLLDADNPAVIRFKPKTVPAVSLALCQDSIASWGSDPSFATSASQYNSSDRTAPSYSACGCSCLSLSLGHRWSAAREYAPLWMATPGWDDAWTPGEISKETCRRLCWHSMMLTAGFMSYMDASRRAMPEFFVGDPANMALLFPGEAVTPAPHVMSYSAKDTVWALNYRTILLWQSCLRMRSNVDASDAERARYGVNAWLEADALEKAFNSHTCGLEKTYIYQGREYLFNVRFTISNEFQQYIPIVTINASGVFYREKAEEWLKNQADVAQRILHGMSAVTGQTQTILHRPVFIFWFMGQINRALLLWERDNSLTLAIDVCVALFKPIDYLSEVWPCREQRRKAKTLREQLTRACKVTGRPLPLACYLSSDTDVM